MPVPGAVVTQVVGGLLGKIKSSAILLGVVYLIAFVFTLPYAATLTGWAGISGAAEIGLAAVLAVTVVTVLLNWIYVALVAAPVIAAAILVASGWAIWLSAPFVAIPVEIAVKVIMGVLSLGSQAGAADSLVTLGVDAATRVGQTLIALGGIFWWAARRLGSVNYIALGAYLTGIGLLGILSGVTGLSGVVVFMLVWLMLYMRIKGDTNLPDLRRLFQVVASLAVIVGAQGINMLALLQLPQMFVQNVPFAQQTGGMQFLGVYRYFIMLLALWGVWSPKSLWHAVPDVVRKPVEVWFASAGGLLRIARN